MPAPVSTHEAQPPPLSSLSGLNKEQIEARTQEMIGSRFVE